MYKVYSLNFFFLLLNQNNYFFFFFVSDAAHRIHPLAGQGVNLGFSDVTELTNQLNKSVLTGADIGLYLSVFKMKIKIAKKLKLFRLCSITGDLNTLLNYETATQRRNVPIMLGIDAIQKVYGSSNSIVPSAITTLVRNVGLSFCQSASSLKVCILSMKLMIIFFFIIICVTSIYFLFCPQKLLSNKASGLPV